MFHFLRRVPTLCAVSRIERGDPDMVDCDGAVSVHQNKQHSAGRRSTLGTILGPVWKVKIANPFAQQRPTASASKSKKQGRFGFIKRCCNDFRSGMKGEGGCSEVGLGGPPKKNEAKSNNRRTKSANHSRYADCGL